MAMRWIIFIFVLGTLGATGGEPTGVALQFLRELKENDDRAPALEKLAISPFCGPGKRVLIDDDWKLRASWAKAGDYAFSAGGEKIDGDLAAVLIGSKSPNGPDSVAILSLGMVQRDGQWKVAPVEGTFQNTGLGFGAGIKARVRALEDWLALERIGGVDKLKSEELERFRKEMEGVLSADVLEMEDPEDVLNHFVKCAEEGNADALLIWQGFLERDQLPERDWERCVRVTRKGLKNEDARSVWRLLTSRKVMKVIVEGQGDPKNTDYLLSFLSDFKIASRNEKPYPVRFNMTMTKAGWRIQLPAFFEFADEDDLVFRTARNRGFDWEDRKGARKMGYVFEEENEKLRSSDPESLLASVIEDLGQEGLGSFLQRHYREVEKREDEIEADDDEEHDLNLQAANGGNGEIDDRRMGRYGEAVKWWGGTLKRHKTLRAKVAKLYKDENLALGVLTLGNSAESWKPSYQTVWMAKEEEGWMILPGAIAPMSNSIAPALMEIQQKFAQQFAKDRETMEAEYLEDVLRVVGIDDQAGKAASEEVAIALVKEWRSIAGKGGMLELLKKSAVRKLPENPGKFLQEVGFVITGAINAKVPDELIGNKVVARFHGVSMMIDDGGGGVGMSCPLIIVTPTKDRHRVLVDVELPLETNKGVRIRNAARMDELKKDMKAEDVAAIEKLRKWHQEVSRPVWEKWEEQKSASE